MIFDVSNLETSLLYPTQKKTIVSMSWLDTASDALHNIALCCNLVFSFLGLFFTQKSLIAEIQGVFCLMFILNLAYIFLFTMANLLEYKHEINTKQV